jgi:hypothetical protein
MADYPSSIAENRKKKNGLQGRKPIAYSGKSDERSTGVSERFEDIRKLGGVGAFADDLEPTALLDLPYETAGAFGAASD